MGTRTDIPPRRRPPASASGTALGIVLLAAGIGVAVVHLVLAPAAYLLQRRGRDRDEAPHVRG